MVFPVVSEPAMTRVVASSQLLVCHPRAAVVVVGAHEDITSALPISRLARPKFRPLPSFLASPTSACLMTLGLFST
jgi:hypothetical protein